ncbi:Serine/threonine-protein kinase SULU [Trichinella britovi]|uniref:Probable tRNA(His) guanylyltransferase n=1 Tax=Trichinella britovi TaxID=45882 RepID=A0A0V1CBJ3_TRIBR|nr:Serine/threonine-protein kinase SULU [Trichinella britovi]
MPIALKPGSLKDPEIAALFRTEDPESYFADLREIGHGSFGAKWNDIVKEVKFLKNLRHENIVEFKACFLKDHTCWLVMEYCVGSASDILEVHKKPLREQEISAICQQVLHGLRYLHSLGRIHRDVKAGNILLTDSGVVKLADFGSASLVCPAQSFVGTPYWMAPEVILAMDEGRYNDRADVWSLGITCIELGTEKKPPFFNMNAMSALYHIAQNDSPSLPVGSWSSDFHDFVDQCLIKDPALRFSTETCLLHPFISSARPASILFDLIQRTKLLVRDLDHFQYRKLRKLMYLDEQQSGSSAEVSSLDSEDIDSVDDDLCAESASSRSDSYTSTQSLCGAMRSSITSVSSLKKAQRSLVPIVPLADDSTTSPLSRTPPPSGSVDTDTDTDVTPPRPSLTPTAKTASMEMNHEQQQQQQHQHQQQEQQQQLSIVGPRRRKEEILAWRRSRFATIRPTVTIAREQTEYAAENNMHEQMSGYKRMRREHQKELKQLEEKFNSEMDNLKMKLDREYENLLLQFHKEMDKLHVTHRQELDKRLKTNEELERKLRKAIVQQQEVEMKALQMQLKKEYKVNKERLKQELKMENSSKSFVEGNLKTSKQNHLHVQAEAENRLIADHKFYLDFEIRKLKRRRLLHYHQLEQDLIREELGVRGRQLQSAHTLLRRHHELTRDLEMRQLNSLQNLRCQHLQKQHASELQNQQAYMKRVQDELRKKHAMQVKQQPKELKQKELQIRRQFRQAVKTQTRQYKLLQLQLTQDLPKDEQREVVARLKDEQKRKLALLAEQYEGSIGEMMEKQTVQLETWQEEEARQTKDKLNEELELLMAFQSKQRMQMDQHHEREKGRLNEKVSLRLAVLENKMDDEVTQFERERQDRLNQLQTRQNQELDVFDQASIHLGFSLIALSASSSSTSTASGSSSSATAVANKPGVINSASIQDAIHQQPTTDNSFQAVTAHHHHQHLSSSSSSSKQRYELLEEDYRKNGRIEGMPILKKEEVCVAFSVDYNKICDSFERLEKRSSIVFSLLQAYGLLDQVRLFKPLIADESTVGVFHSDDYISFVKNASAGLIAEVEDVESEPMRDYGLGYDCPIFPALYEYGRATVGATVHCAQLLVDGKAKLAVNVNGGWHHARRSAAAGFCYFNDCVVGILKLRERFKRVLYIDLDAHHGDAVEDAFCSTRSVLTVSLHCYEAGFYPCSGSMDDVGVGSGKYYAVNVPFRQGLVDEQLLSTFDALVPKIVHLYRPEVVFLQLGTDGLAGDPVAAFNLTPSAYAGVVCRVLGFGKPCLLVGGGGYKPTNVSRCWALVLGALLGQNLDDDIPEHAFFSAYGPDFVLCNRHSTGTIPNLNTDHQLNELYILERNKKNKNGTRRKNCPKLWLVMEPDDDLIAWVDPDLLAREKKITAIKKMLYASSGISNGLPSSTSSTRTTINDGRLSLSSLADSVAQLRFANSGDSGNSNENASSTAVERSRSLDSCLFVEFDPLNDEHYSSTSANPAEVESGPDLVVEESKKPTEGDNHAACGQQFFHLVDYCSNASLQTRRLVDYSKSVIADLVDQSDIYRKLVVSRRRFDLVSPDTSLKVTVHTPFDQTAPVLLFACHIRSSIGQIIGCVLCSFNSTRLLPIEQYAIKTAKIDESSLLPTLINNNNNVNSTTGIGLLKRDDLQVVLNTIRQECEKLIDESAAVDAVLNGEMQSEIAIRKKYKNVKNAISYLVDAIEKFCINFCQSFEVDFSVELSANFRTDPSTSCPFRPLDITDSEVNFHFMIETVHSLPQNWTTKYSQFYLACHLIHGDRELCSAFKTNCGRSDRHFYEYLFILLNGTKFVTFYPGSELKSWLPQLSCQWSESPICVVSFPYNEPKMRFPHILPNATLNIGKFDQLDCNVKLLLEDMIENRALKEELESHKTHPGLGLRCRLLQNVLVTVVGPGMPTEVRLQVELLSRLDSISEMVKRESRDDKKSKALLVQLHLLDSWLLQTHVRVPLNPSVLAVGVFTENSKIYRSLTCPVKVSFRTVSSNFDVMYKSGDDLRQDSLVLQMIRLMDHLWLKENLDLRMVVFRILPLQDKKGVIELVKNSKTLREIQVEEGGMTGVLRDDLIQKWLQKQNPSELEYQIALKNFRLSCAGWSVGTYVLGIGDRHNDNVMITSKGHLFHIDFGKYLGDAQMFGSFRRDRVPFLLTNDMLYAINAGESTKSAFFQQFVDCCCNAFNIIRKHSTLFVNLMQLVMLYSSIPGLTRDSIAYMYQNFWLECTDSEASMRFTRLIEETLRSKFPKLNFLVHTVVQGQRKTGHLSTGQILSFVPQTYTAQTDGTIQSVQVIDCEKWHVPAKVYMYKMKVERENVKVPSFVYRSYDEFCEFAESIYFRFPLIKMHSLPRGVTLRSNVRGVAVRRQSEIAQFIRSLFHYAEEISHSDLVYTFFHPIFRDEQADIKSKTQNLHHPENVSGEVKVQVEFRQGLLEIFINHARNLSLINGINLPDSYVKCYILPDKRGWSKKKTRVVRGTRDPTYNEMFVYRVPASQLKCKVLEISVWHYDLLKGNNFLGSIAIPMADICDIPVQMANTKWAYVRKFEQAEMCLMNTWIVVRLDGCSFRRFTEEHRFEKPNDLAGLKLMYSAAKSVMNNYKDIRIAYGHSDEFSFVFWKRTNLWNRRLQKFVSTITSLFTSNYIFQWNFHFNDNRPLIWAPCFDGRVILYPTDENLTDYLKWRQADCHINNLYNTVFWKLVNEGQLKPAEAEKRLCGSTAADKNEILFSQFNTNYNNEPDIFRKGTVLYRNVDGETVNTFHGSIIDDQFWQSNAHLLN